MKLRENPKDCKACTKSRCSYCELLVTPTHFNEEEHADYHNSHETCELEDIPCNYCNKLSEYDTKTSKLRFMTNFKHPEHHIQTKHSYHTDHTAELYTDKKQFRDCLFRMNHAFNVTPPHTVSRKQSIKSLCGQREEKQSAFVAVAKVAQQLTGLTGDQ